MREDHKETKQLLYLLCKFNSLTNKLLESGLILEHLIKKKKGNFQCLCQLTSIIFGECELPQHISILVNIGSGYYVEKTPMGAMVCSKKRLEVLQQKLTGLQKMMLKKFRRLTVARQNV